MKFYMETNKNNKLNGLCMIYIVYVDRWHTYLKYRYKQSSLNIWTAPLFSMVVFNSFI